MNAFDKAAIERIETKLDMDKEEAMELISIIKKIAADEYYRHIEVPF